MERSKGTARWTRAYLELAEEDDQVFSADLAELRPSESFAAPVESFAEVYLEWLEAA